MSARNITITGHGVIVVLRGWRAAQLARQAGLKPTYSGTVQGWMLDTNRLPDLVAWLESRNVRYELEGDQPPDPPSFTPRRTEGIASVAGEWALW